MQRLEEEEILKQIRPEETTPKIEGFKYTIDTKGTVIFTLPDGGVIRDDGREILFSGRNQEAKEVAALYAKAKWGRNVSLEDNAFSKMEPRSLVC